MVRDHLDMLAWIGANVRRVRERRNITQRRLADDADLDYRFVQRVERGHTNMSVLVLAAIAKVLRIRPAALLRQAKLRPARPGRPPARRQRAVVSSGDAMPPGGRPRRRLRARVRQRG